MRIRFFLRTMILGPVLAISLGAYAAPGEYSGHGAHAEPATAPAIGQAGQAAQVSRTISVDMVDAMRFNPSQVAVKAGETVRFKVTNSGKMQHEFVLGTEADLAGHYQMMLKYPGMRHTEANSVSLPAGKSGEVIWQFDKAGTVAFGCLEPGHYPAGMKGVVAVR